MSKTIKSALPLLFGNCVTMFLLLAGGLFSFLSAYDIRQEPAPLLLGCAGIACLCTVLWSVPHGGWTALGLLGAAAFAAWRLRETLGPPLKLLWTVAAWDAERSGDLGRDGALTGTLLLLVLLLGLLLGWLAVRERCWHLPAVLLTMPLLSAILSGTLPDLLPLLAQCAGWLTLLVTSLYDRKEVRSIGKGVWISLGGVSALLLLLWAALPQEGYTRPQWATQAKNHVVDTVTKYFSGFVWEGSGGNGSLDFGAEGSESGSDVDGAIDLTEAGARRYSENVVLQLLGGQPGRVYLRGGSSGTYTGDSWEPSESRLLITAEIVETESDGYGELRSWPAQENSWADPAFFPALTAPDSMPVEEITVRHVQETGDTAYIPYRLLDFPNGFVELSGDGNAVRRAQEYSVAYIPGGPSEFRKLGDTAAEAEAFYRQYVYMNYLDVPEDARTALLPLIEQVQRRGVSWPSELPEPFQEKAAAALRTAAVLSDTAVYDLQVTAIRRGEDFVQHFLREKRGYCVHFATAGTLLLRMQGIPARYVEGYAAQVEESGFSYVQDSDAHAWTEIYLDGYGWYPVEMTPGRQGETPDSAAPEILQANGPEETEEPVLPEEDAPEIKHDPAEDLDMPSGENPQEEQDQPESAGLGWLWKTTIILLAAAAPYGAYRAAGVVRKSRRMCADSNQSVIYAYLRYQKLTAWGGSEEPALEVLARKAKFSQHTMTREERENAWGWVRHAEEQVWNRLSVWKRMRFLIGFGGEL